MALIQIGQTITTQQYADTVDKSLPYSHNAFLFYVDVTLISQDEINATSKITIRHRLKCIRSYWSNYSNVYGEIAIGNDVKDTKYLATTELGKTYTLGTWTGDVAHDEDGELSITVNGNWYGDYGSSRYSPENNVLANIIDFPAIQKVSKLSVTPATLTSGNLSITITKYVSTYTTTIKYKVEGTEYTLATKSAGTSFSLSFNDLKALIGSFTSSVVEITAITYNNDFEVGSDRKSIIVQTGNIPLSLYDNRQGSVGVTFGEEATGAGARFKMPAYFDDEVYGIPIPDPPSFTAAWSGVCKFGSTITCTIPNTAQMIICRWLVNTYHSTLAIPVALLNSTMTRYIVSDDSYFAGGELKLVDTTLTYKGTANKNSECYLKDIYYM